MSGLLLRKRAWMLASLGGLLLVVGVAATTNGFRPQEGRWVSAERRDLVLTVPVTGELKAEDSAQLGPPQTPGIWNFKLTFMAPEGSVVRTGQPVLGFDDSELRRDLERVTSELESALQEVAKLESDSERQVRQQELELAEAQAKLRKAELKLQVPKSLRSRNEIREARIDHKLAETEVLHQEERLLQRRRSTAAELSALRETRDRAKARVEQIRDQLTRMTVQAPRDGTVIYVTDGRGEKKKPGDSCWWGERVIDIPNLERMGAKGEVEEVLAGRLEVGDPVHFRLDAFPDLEHAARIRSIGSTVRPRSFRDPVKVVRLELELEDMSEAQPRPGMRFEGEVEVDRISQALAVPLAAVQVQGGGPGAQIKGALGRELVPLRLGRRDGEWVEVLEGLEEGDQIWWEGT